MLHSQLLVLLSIAGAWSLIPRETLFSHSINPGSLSLTPDGKIMGYVALDANNTKNVFMWDLSNGKKRQVTFETRDVLAYYWTGVKDIILFVSDNYGDENTMMFKKNISEASSPTERTVVYQKRGVMAVMMSNNVKENYVLIGINDVDPRFHNVYKYDILTNEHTLIFPNKRFSSVITDNKMRIRMTSEEQEDGSTIYYRVSPKSSKDNSTDYKLEEYVRVRKEDNTITKFIGFDESNKNLYWIWGEKSNLGNLITAPISDFNKRKVIHTPTRSEIDFILFHPEHRTIKAISENYFKPELVALDNSTAQDLRYLRKLRPNGSVQVLSMSRDMDTWLITYLSSEKPFEIFLYQCSKRSAKLLLNINPDLAGYALNKQIGFDFTTRDGLTIQAYLSLPPRVPLRGAPLVPRKDRAYAAMGMIPMKPQKMVLLVHGGPQARDDYGFDKMNAFLTSRGYAVMQVNYRGSTGFGKNLTNAGNGEWSRKMHNDLIDAVEFAIARRIANRSEVAIMGISYGGYATLVGLTFTPDYFACGVDIVGPVNLVTLMEALPPYWNDVQNIYAMVGGDPHTAEGRKELEARSPLFKAQLVKKPLMIMQGANDPRVKQHESEQFVEALRNHSIPYTYVLYPDEGHGFRRTPNSMAMFGFVEKFLHKCLGGDYQPFTMGQYNESAIVETKDFGKRTA